MVAKALGRRRLLIIPSGPAIFWITVIGGEVISQIRRKPLYVNFDKTRDIRAGDWTCSARKATEELGFVVESPIAEWLLRTADWYRHAGWV
jgi:hypothetical protein